MEKELELINREVCSDDLYLLLSGLLITEELDMIIKLCKSKNNVNSLPLYVEIEDSKERVGDFDVTLDDLLTLHSLSPSYTLRIIDEESKQEKIIFSPDDQLGGDELLKFISL